MTGKHTLSVAFSTDLSVLKVHFREAVLDKDYAAAHWWNRVEVAALMFGNYNLAEATDREESTP